MRTTFRTTVAVLALALWAGLAVPARAQAIKIGVFDPARVSEEVADAQQLQASLVQMREIKQTAIAAKEQSLNDLRQRLQQQLLSQSPDKRTTMEVDIQRKVIEVNSMKEVANQELQLEFAAAEARFNDKLRQVVDQFAREKGFDMILDINAVAWSSVAIDVTTPIVDKYNQLFPAPAAAAAGQ